MHNFIYMTNHFIKAIEKCIRFYFLLLAAQKTSSIKKLEEQAKLR